MKFPSLIGLLFICPFGSVTFAEEGELAKAQIDKWSLYYGMRAAEYDIRIGEGANLQKLKLIETPVMRWANPIRSTTHGECFIWTHRGRPEVFVSLFSYPKGTDRTVAHAFNSLSDETLIAKHSGTEFWNPRPGSAESMRVPDAPPVADSRTKRLLQMRRMVRDFSATAGGTNGDEKLALRLLPTPLYRYPQSEPTDPDGALFAFVMGTDPEVILLLETRELDSERQWYFLAARHTYTTLRVAYNKQDVWTYRRGEPNSSGQQHIYRSQHGIDTQPRLLP